MGKLIATIRKGKKGFDAVVKSANGVDTVGTTHNQGYTRPVRPRVAVEHILLAGPHIVHDIKGKVVEPTPAQVAARLKTASELPARSGRPKLPYVGHVYQRRGGKYAWRITARSNPNKPILTDHGQGYDTPQMALKSLREVCHGAGHRVEG